MHSHIILCKILAQRRELRIAPRRIFIHGRGQGQFAFNPVQQGLSNSRQRPEQGGIPRCFLIFPKVRFHDLRHSRATISLGGGVDLKLVSERLGRTMIAITADLYLHPDHTMHEAACHACLCLNGDEQRGDVF